MTFRASEIVCPGRPLIFTTCTYPGEELMQYLTAPAG
jgi:hypothetical protein